MRPAQEPSNDEVAGELSRISRKAQGGFSEAMWALGGLG